MLRVEFVPIFALMLFLTACSGGGPAADPGPLLTIEPVPSIEAVATADNSLSGSAGLNTPEPLLCESAQDADAVAFMQEVIRLTNIERGKVKAAALTAQAQLTEAAQVHAVDMACNLFLSHTGSDGSSPFERMTRFGYVYSAAAENVAAGYPAPADVVKGWMASSGHRQNMLNAAFSQIGIGYVHNADSGAQDNYLHYWVMTLARP